MVLFGWVTRNIGIELIEVGVRKLKPKLNLVSKDKPNQIKILVWFISWNIRIF